MTYRPSVPGDDGCGTQFGAAVGVCVEGGVGGVEDDFGIEDVGRG